MDITYWIIWFIVHALIIVYCCSDWHYGKTLYKKAHNITKALNLTEDIKDIEVRKRGKTFNIKVEQEKGPEGISFISSRYTYQNVYINDELVCRVHSITSNIFTSRSIAEFSSKRDEAETVSLINLAAKEATRLQKNYYNNRSKHKSNSFFN
jgi:hypothetical protein